MTNRIDLGDGHSMTWGNYEGERAAANVYHPRPDNGKECVGFISFRGRAWSRQFENSPSHQAWDVAQDDPLTLSPSILCRACGDHGYIRDGKWVRA